MARASWEANPDKHPHRMAHFGTFAFRLKHPLSIFDFGIESFTGNAIFMEAHKNHTANFSEASFSTGLLRFGELSMAMILQTILPLLIFFIGYSAVVADRENGTLKILLTQGANWKEILFGRALGLLGVALLISLPFIIAIIAVLIFYDNIAFDEWLRLSIITMAYLFFIFILCFVTIVISSGSRSSKSALVKLLGIWLLMVVLIPKVSQAIGAYIYQSPSKIAFSAAIEEEVIQHGDSHNPDDPHYNALKDSVLKVHKVKDVTDLPFNYGGLVMQRGEKITSNIYNKHHQQLLNQYRKQNQLTRWLAILNPYLAIKNLSMAISGTDFESYINFQLQAEKYRYELAQKMNELQIKYISPKKVSGSEGKKHVISREEWKALPDFEHKHLSIAKVLQNEIISMASILIWLLLSFLLLVRQSKTAKAI